MFKKMFAGFLSPDDGLEIGGAGAEELEVADPVESEEGAEEPEAADPAEEAIEGPSDSAWAEMRRRAEAAEEQNTLLAEALGMYFPSEDPMEMAIQAKANALGVDPEIERARFEAEREKEQLATKNEALEEQLNQIKIERLMDKGLSEIKTIDPAVKELSDLGPDFPRYIAAGLSSLDAYYAVKAKEAKTKVNPPKPIGRVSETSPDGDFYTKEEVDAMSDEEIEKNLETIRKSIAKWK